MALRGVCVCMCWGWRNKDTPEMILFTQLELIETSFVL